ncbi:MAG: PadR family transcriptional regulator [Christensenellales bacterium]
MSEKINSDLIRGSVNTIVLRSLFESDRYGYEIIKYVEEQTNGQYILKQPTLYSSLRRLENMGFVSFYWGEETHGGRRKYYTLTDLGRSVFEKIRTSTVSPAK